MKHIFVWLTYLTLIIYSIRNHQKVFEFHEDELKKYSQEAKSFNSTQKLHPNDRTYFRSIINLFLLKSKSLIKLQNIIKYHQKQMMLCLNTKSTYYQQLNQVPPLLITIKPQEIVRLIQEESSHCYTTEHNFIKMYLNNFIMPKNNQLVEDTLNFINNTNKKKFKTNELETCLMSWIKNDRSPLGVTLILWLSYLEYEARNKGNIHEFLTDEIEQFTKMMIKILQNIYPIFKKEQNIEKFKFTLLDYISQNKLFKSIMNSYLQQYDKAKGVGGELTPSQILATVDQIQELINFSQLLKPFQKSMKLIELFHIEHCLSKKIKYLIDTIHQIKDQITEYRAQFQLEAAAVGFDQLFPLVCFVCEESHSNILASINYINAFLGTNIEKKENLLRVASVQAFYNMELMEAASSFYCHASKFY